MSSKSGASRVPIVILLVLVRIRRILSNPKKGGGNWKNQIAPVLLAADSIACHDSVLHSISEVVLPNCIHAL